MPEFLITEEAQKDLEDIDRHISTDNTESAVAVIDDLYAAMTRAAENPEGAGNRRADLTSRSVRFILVRRTYWVIYTVSDSGEVAVIRVLRARRNIQSTL